MKKTLLGAMLGATLLTGAAAVAAQDPTPTDRRHNMAQQFDTNKDGTISAEERQAGRAARRAHMLQRFDADKNGTLSKTERQTMRAEFPRRHGMKQGRRHGGRGGMFGERMVARVDTNRDGAISRNEMLAHAAARFDRLDANKDGRIDKAEHQAQRQARKAQRRQMRQTHSAPAVAPSGQ